MMNPGSPTSEAPVIALLAIIALICLVGIIKGLRNGKPPFQKGLKGTAFADSRKLMWIQMIMCSILLLASLFAITMFI
jgi:hypothetical protein